jgi:hypothetical protein
MVLRKMCPMTTKMAQTIPQPMLFNKNLVQIIGQFFAWKINCAMLKTFCTNGKMFPNLVTLTLETIKTNLTALQTQFVVTKNTIF